MLAFVLCAFAVLNSAAAFAAGSNETAASGITVESANGAERVIPSIVSADEWEVLRLVNSERSARGLSPLTTFSTLQSGAEIRAREIVALFSHTRPNGESCFTVLDEVGIGNYQSAGENIAAGQNSPAAVMNSWMNSEGHRNNILSSSYKHIGVGMKHEPNSIYGKHWVQLFCAGFSERYTECSLMLPSSMQFPLGTSISSMGIAVRLRSNVWGDCYMPLSDEFCTGFNSGSAGEQTVTVNIEGCTAVFSVVLAAQSGIPGDVDGDGRVTSSDALMIMRHALGVVHLSGAALAAADADGDGNITAADSLLAMRTAMGF